uniref:Kinase-like protein n=1 Tax=Mycena chlorophos TaxID=658473 RepID=A0ABQ0L8M5_MYCCL|nr:kinase-like protein [Mycena chlorophos]
MTVLPPLPSELQQWRDDRLATPPLLERGSWEVVEFGCDDIFTPFVADIVINPDPCNLGSGARVIIHYCHKPEPRQDATFIAIPEVKKLPCDEQSADVVVSKLTPVAGQCTEVWVWGNRRGTLEGCFVQHNMFHIEPPPSEDLRLPILEIEALTGNYTLRHGIVVLSLVELDDGGMYVLKTPRRDEGFAAEALQMVALPPSDYCIRPSHSVKDRNGCWRGVLFPYEANGALHEFLVEEHPNPHEYKDLEFPPSRVPWRVKLVWARDIGAALEWLHGHLSAWGDLKLDNIVVCRDGHCRLIDYAGPTFRTHLSWAAPEFQFGKPRTTAEDVFSLGLLLWVIATERLAIPRQDGILNLQWPTGVDPTYQALVKRCTDATPSSRPTMSEINHEINKLICSTSS